MSESIEKVLTYLGEKQPKKPATAAKRGKRSPGALDARIQRAPLLPNRVIARLAEKLDVSDLVILDVSDIPERTFQRRKAKQEPLSATESDRVLRIARVANKAEGVFDNPEKARRWLSAPNRLLGAKPLDLLATDAGAREVEDELIRIDFGDFA